jgi:hypothetical protein
MWSEERRRVSGSRANERRYSRKISQGRRESRRRPEKEKRKWLIPKARDVQQEPQ